jgi:prophage maintenance system killer protein
MDFSPPEWTDVEPYMAQLGAELKQTVTSKSIVQQATEAHSKFTSIHPFSDGNGRTARLLMNAILGDAGLPVITIAHSEKGRYLDALASSNKGDISELCILIAEAIESTLEQLAGNVGIDEPVQLAAAADSLVTRWVPSKELAEIMQARLKHAPVARKTRFEAWAAAFDSLREDFKTTCLGFNELYGAALYRAAFAKFDKVPFEKYEDLLRRKPVPKTWLMGLEISSDSHSERFVFWFRHISSDFQLKCKEMKPRRQLPPAEVSLGISRRVGGTFQSLRDEPIRLREIAYINGEWLSMLCLEGQKYQVQQLNMTNAFDMFLLDAIDAYL